MSKKAFLLGAVLACCTVGAVAQMLEKTAVIQTKDKKGNLLQSPRMLTTSKVGGSELAIEYGAPSLRGRNVFFDLVPLDKVWRTGANEATGFKTSGTLMLGSLHVPPGSYTLYTLPTKDGWWLIVNKQTGQWGLDYDSKQDLGRIKMEETKIPVPQEKLSITVEDIAGKMAKLHLRWAHEDLTVPVMSHQ